MKNFKLKKPFLWLLTALLLFGCKEDEVIPPEEISPPVVSISGIPAGGFGFLYFEETQKAFTVESDSPWEISKTDGWFTVAPYKGSAGTTEVKVYVVNNDDIARNGEFTVTANSGTLLKPVEDSQTFTVSQTAYLSAGISIDGLTSDNILFDANAEPLSLNFLAAYPWSITLCDDNTWVSVSPTSGAGRQSVTITITPAANTVSEPRECTLTITCTDPQNSNNTDEKVIELRQRPFYEWDTNLVVGAMLFEDNFDWIAPLWPATSSKYGYPSVTLGTPEVTGSNEPALSTASFSTEIANRGWTFVSAYARYEGWVKIGVAASMGHITTPALTAIAPGKVVNLLLSFDESVYASATGNSDATTGSNIMTISVIGDGTINDTEEQSMDFPIISHFAFDRYYFLVRGATASTQIRIGATTPASNRRFIVDNIKVERVANFDPVVPPTEVVVLEPDYEVIPYNTGKVIEQGALLRYSIRVNRAWTATPSDNWLRFTQVQGGGTGVATGTSGNGGSVSGGVGSAIANAIAYNHCFIAVDPNPTTAERTATIAIASGGNPVTSFTITQEAGTFADEIILTGITDDKVTLVAEDPSMVLFKVNATSAWDLTYADTWYTILPVVGVPNKDVEVVLVPTDNSGTPRTGSFTITAGSVSKTVAVEQAGLAPTEEILASWMLPFKGTATSSYFTNYVANDGTADLNLGQWWVKSDDGNSIIRGSRANEHDDTQVHMSYSTYAQPGNANQDRIIMYGLDQGDYWQMEIPTTGIAAGSDVKIEGFMQGSASGARDYLFRYSTDLTNWTSINPKTAGAITYTVQLPNAETVLISETFTIGSAIPSGMLYIQLYVNSTYRTSGSSSIGLGGTSWITRPVYTDDTDKLPIMKVSKL